MRFSTEADFTTFHINQTERSRQDRALSTSSYNLRRDTFVGDAALLGPPRASLSFGRLNLVAQLLLAIIVDVHGACAIAYTCDASIVKT